MIYTSNFRKLKSLPEGVIPISICGKAPDWYTGLQYKKLAPKYWFFIEWKVTKDNNFYTEHYNREVLSRLMPNEVLDELFALAKSDKIALICYEKPEDFCHRHLVSDWLNKNNIKSSEFA